MSVFNAYMRLSGSVDASIMQNEKLSHHMPYAASHDADCTSDLYIVVNDYKALMTTIDILESEDIPWHVIGKGTSFLPVNVPYHGALIELGREFKKIEFDMQTGRVSAGAACKLTHVVIACAGEGVKYLECVAGIPGTVGASVYLNVAYERLHKTHWADTKLGKFTEGINYIAKRSQGALADLSFILELVESLVIYNPQTHSLQKLYHSDLWDENTKWGDYCPLPEGAVILEVCFDTAFVKSRSEQMVLKDATSRSKQDSYDESVSEYTDYVIRTTLSRQPQNIVKCLYPYTARSYDQAETYGKIINKMFAEGLSFGTAYVDPNYPEFILHTSPTYQCEDVIKCMKYIQKEVKEVAGIDLQPKITFLGVS